MLKTRKKNSAARNLFAVLALVLAMLALPAAAAAQQLEPTADQYDDTRGQIVALADSGDPGNTGTAGNDQIGSLPFTGLDVVGLLAVAAAVTGLGLVLQRTVSRRSDQLS